MEETVLLKFEIDQAKAEQDLVKTNKAILQNKEAQQELNKAYKEGAISQEEFVAENIKLQNNLKKNQDQSKLLNKLIGTEANSRDALKIKISQLAKEYDNINTKSAQGAKRAEALEKELAKLNAQLTKGNKAAGLFKNEIGNYPEAFKNAASNINVAGVSVADIGAKLVSFANPATAAVGIVSALGAAYARSTIGAKDLEFAQNQLSSAVTLSTNAFASLISSAEDGQGIFSKLLGGLLFQLSPTLATLSAISAKNIEELEDLQREEIALRDKINDRLETNQELLTEIQAEQTKYNDKIYDADSIIDNLRANESELLELKNRQLKSLELQLALDKNNEGVQTSVLEKQREISNIERDTEKRVQAILRLKDNINQAEAKRIALEKQRINEFTKTAETFVASRDRLPGDEVVFNDQEVKPTVDPLLFDIKKREEAEKDHNNVIKQLFAEREYIYVRDEKAYAEAQRLKQEADEQYLAAAANTLSQAASLFGEKTVAYKLTASAETLISTYSAAQKSYESLSGIPVVGPALGAAAAAIAIASGLQNVAAINGVEFAEGGWTGPGNKYDVAGVVHADEYVAPKHIVNHPAAQPHINALEGMRVRGYADGGFVANQSTAETNNSLLIANAMKNQPPIYASWVEGQKVGNKIQFKQNVASI